MEASANLSIPDPVLEDVLEGALEDVLRAGAVRSVFQPIVDLTTGAVVAYEALARGPQGPLSEPAALFGAARRVGRLAELDAACRAAAVRGAGEHGLLAPLMLFVNVEPEVLDAAPLHDLMHLVEDGGAPLRLVLEITERALARRPAELLHSVERVRACGWNVALDDVGADPASLAFMPLVRPDIVKLDLALVQRRPDAAIAEIMNAVNAYAERSGALLLAEGIEHEAHLRTARALGATLGQGWLFGRPAAGPATSLPTGSITLSPPLPLQTAGPTAGATAGSAGHRAGASPFELLPAGTAMRRSAKSLLIEVSKQLEREAMRLGETCVVAATFQEARHFTPATALRYRDLVARGGFVCALGHELPVEPAPGVRGAALAPGDPLLGEWDVVVLSPHFSAALLARDLGDTGPDLQRRFEFALTYDRDTVVAAAHNLVSRVAGAPRSAVVDAGTAPSPYALVPPATDTTPATGTTPSIEPVLHQALAATTSGVTIVDMHLPDQPLVFVNAAFVALSGLPESELVGRNCRFLQSPDTDPAALGRIRRALDAGQECRETLLNVRGPDRTPWWNEVHLTPVRDTSGTVVQYIGVQHDVTERVEAQRSLEGERHRARGYLARIDHLSGSDPLTGLLARDRLRQRVEVALWDATAAEEALAVVVVRLDGLPEVVADLGHSAGDVVVKAVGRRLRGSVRRGDLVARLVGDHFAVALLALDRRTAGATAVQKAQALRARVAEPLTVAGRDVRLAASAGIGLFPVDDEDFDTLLRTATRRSVRVAEPAGRRSHGSSARPGWSGSGLELGQHAR